MLLKNELWRGSKLFFKVSDEKFRKIPYRFFRKSSIIESKSLKVSILGCTGKTGKKIIYYYAKKVKRN